MKNVIICLAVLMSLWTVDASAQDNTLTPREEKDGWVLLFNGRDLTGWVSPGKDTPPEIGWVVENGILTVRRPEGAKRGGGDIITKDQYSDFDLKVDFLLTPVANSGIKYFFVRYEKGGWLGLEYQLMDDDTHPDAKLGRDGNRKMGGLYDMIPARPGKVVKPIGEWNQARIVAKGTKVTHYLNGKKTVTFDRKSPEYKQAYELSKYMGSVPAFGDVEQGHILLQDHGDVVSFRNVKIKVLK
jgi:hypothetical protein